MTCKHCGANNPEGAKFCRGCGQPLARSEPARSKPPQFEPAKPDPPKPAPAPSPKPLVPEGEHQDPVCPHCGGTDCQPVSRTTGSLKGGGYSISDGCCGMCLLGPFGLLCGLLGSGGKMDLKNEVVWVCRSCGKQHLAQKDALEKATAMAGSMATGLVVAALVISVGVHFYDWTWLLAVACCISPLIGYGIIEEQITEELGYPMKEILPPSTSIPLILIGAEIGVILLLWIGGPMVFDLLESLQNQ